MPDVTSRTLIAQVRLRHAREHRRIEDRLRTLTDFANAIASFDPGIRRHNARAFQRHAPDWQPTADDFPSCPEPKDPDHPAGAPLPRGNTGLLTTTLRRRVSLDHTATLLAQRLLQALREPSRLQVSGRKSEQLTPRNPVSTTTQNGSTLPP